MLVEELRSFCQVPANISLELSYGVVVSIVGGVDNVVYLTQDQFPAILRFPILSLVKQSCTSSGHLPRLYIRTSFES